MPLSRHTKIKLISDVSDENFFRKDVLIPLFRNMGQFEQVLDNHGASEKGTDIVLVESATFGGYRYTSVIVKCLPINNATSSRKDRETAANVLQQMTLALNTGHYCNLVGHKVDFQTILVVTNQTISNTAREVLIVQGKQYRLNDTRFLQQDDLIDLFDTYLPNFYYYRSGTLARIAVALQEKCERISDLQNIPQFTGKDRALIEVFVKPQLQRFESRSTDSGVKNQFIITTPDEVISKENHILIIGEAGSGKSIIMREAVLSLLSQNTRDKTSRLPLLLKAYDLAKASSLSFQERIDEVIRRYYNLPDFELSTARNDAKIVLLIDGLDEISNPSLREELRLQIVEFGKVNQDVQIVVTSRRTQDILPTDSMPSYERWEVLPFNAAQVKEFIGKWFSSRPESINRLIAALEDHNLLSRLPNTPLVLTLLAILFDSDSYREIPANLAELYQMFLDLLLGKWNLDRRVETMHNANIREHLAMTLAMQMHRDHSQSISKIKFREIVETVEVQRGLTLNVENLLDDFTEQTALLVFNDRGELEFRHLSFQEFLAGLSVYKQGGANEVSFLVQHFSESWWTKVLYFYCGLRQDTPEVLTSVVEGLTKMNPRQEISSIFELGYLVQAAYLTLIGTRLDVVHTALQQFYGALNSVNDIRLNNKKFPQGILLGAFVLVLSMHYESRMLQKFYLSLLEELRSKESNNEEDSFVQLALATCIALSGNLQPLNDIYGAVKRYPKQILMLNFVGSFVLSKVSADEQGTEKIKGLKAVINKTERWLKSHPDITQNMLGTTNPLLLDRSD